MPSVKGSYDGWSYLSLVVSPVGRVEMAFCSIRVIASAVK